MRKLAQPRLAVQAVGHRTRPVTAPMARGAGTLRGPKASTTWPRSNQAPTFTRSEAGFKAAFTGAEGWGTYEQRSAKGKFEAKLELKYGKLAVRKLTFETGAQGAIKVQGPSSLAVTVSREGNRLTVEFGKAVSLKAGQSLSVAVG